MGGIVQVIGRVRVRHQGDFGIALADCRNRRHIPTGFDLHLDPAVTFGEARPDILQELVGGCLDADADAGLHPVPNAAQECRERFAGALGQRGSEGHLEAGFRHVVAAHRRE